MSVVHEEQWLEEQLKKEPALQAFVIEAARVGGDDQDGRYLDTLIMGLLREELGGA